MKTKEKRDLLRNKVKNLINNWMQPWQVAKKYELKPYQVSRILSDTLIKDIKTINKYLLKIK